MRTLRAQAIRATENGQTTTIGRRRLRMVAAQRCEEILAEVAPTLRRLRTLLLVATISIPLFLTGLVAVLWHLAH